MKNNFVAKLILVLLTLALTACSKHWREGDAGISDDQLFPKIQESVQFAMSSGAIPSTDLDRFNRLLNDENTMIYYAESNQAMGPAQNVTAMADWSFLGSQGIAQFGGNIFPENVEQVRVVFLDLPFYERIENALLFDITSQGRHIVKIFFNDSMSTDVEPSYFDSGEFISQMSSSDGATVLVRSLDTEDDLLQSVIQLELYDYDGAGNELLTGKITTLVGFEP